MKKAEKISLHQCCIHYQIETSFVEALDEHGLIQLTRSGKQVSITYEQLPDLEKYMHLHYDLDINIEGMEAIRHLLNRMVDLQHEIKKLQNELGQS